MIVGYHIDNNKEEQSNGIIQHIQQRQSREARSNYN